MLMEPAASSLHLKTDEDAPACTFVQPPMGWNSYDSQVGLKNGNGGQGEAVALESAQFVAKNLAHLGYVSLTESPLRDTPHRHPSLRAFTLLG